MAVPRTPSSQRKVPSKKAREPIMSLPDFLDNLPEVPCSTVPGDIFCSVCFKINHDVAMVCPVFSKAPGRKEERQIEKEIESFQLVGTVVERPTSRRVDDVIPIDIVPIEEGGEDIIQVVEDEDAEIAVVVGEEEDWGDSWDDTEEWDMDDETVPEEGAEPTGDAFESDEGEQRPEGAVEVEPIPAGPETEPDAGEPPAAPFEPEADDMGIPGEREEEADGQEKPGFTAGVPGRPTIPVENVKEAGEKEEKAEEKEEQPQEKKEEKERTIEMPEIPLMPVQPPVVPKDTEEVKTGEKREEKREEEKKRTEEKEEQPQEKKEEKERTIEMPEIPLMPVQPPVVPKDTEEVKTGEKREEKAEEGKERPEEKPEQEPEFTPEPPGMPPIPVQLPTGLKDETEEQPEGKTQEEPEKRKMGRSDKEAEKPEPGDKPPALPGDVTPGEGKPAMNEPGGAGAPEDGGEITVGSLPREPDDGEAAPVVEIGDEGDDQGIEVTAEVEVEAEEGPDRETPTTPPPGGPSKMLSPKEMKQKLKEGAKQKKLEEKRKKKELKEFSKKRKGTRQK